MQLITLLAISFATLAASDQRDQTDPQNRIIEIQEVTADGLKITKDDFYMRLPDRCIPRDEPDKMHFDNVHINDANVCSFWS
jgi:hypothetical protein